MGYGSILTLSRQVSVWFSGAVVIVANLEGTCASEIASDDAGFVDLGLDTRILGCFCEK
jgi:hypothetical protein